MSSDILKKGALEFRLVLVGKDKNTGKEYYAYALKLQNPLYIWTQPEYYCKNCYDTNNQSISLDRVHIGPYSFGYRCKSCETILPAHIHNFSC